MKSKKTNNKGFTLLELLLYFSITGIFLFTSMLFAFQIIRASSTSDVYRELQENTDFIGSKINTAIKTAQGLDIADCIFEDDEGALSLQMSDPAKSPTRFYFSDGDILMKEGGADAIRLNSEFVALEFLRFEKTSFHKVPPQINVQSRIGIKNVEMAHMDKLFDIYLTVSLRQL